MNAAHAAALEAAPLPGSVESLLDLERELRDSLERFVLPPHLPVPAGCEALLRHQFSQLSEIVSLLLGRSPLSPAPVRSVTLCLLPPATAGSASRPRDERFLHRLIAAHRLCEAEARALMRRSPAEEEDAAVFAEVAWRHEHLAEMMTRLPAG